jgi:hypothetical protein
MWWLTYRHFTRLQVIIIQAGSLVQAPTAVSVLRLDDGATFQEGHELDAVRVKRVSKAALLSRRAAEAVLKKLET